VLIAFIGYVLPCTQMSYWGLTVFSNIISTIPFFGQLLCYWLWGSEYIHDFTIIKCHSCHIVLPLLMLFFLLAHLFCLHYFISSDGFYDRFSLYYERVLFLVWFYIRDVFFGISMWCLCFYFVLCYWYFVFHEESFCVVDVLKTSDKVIPEWFFLIFFGFIKCIPSKFLGVLILGFYMFLIFTFVILCTLWFLYCRSIVTLFMFAWFLLSILIFISTLSVYVVLCFPIWEELQIWVLSVLICLGCKY